MIIPVGHPVWAVVMDDEDAYVHLVLGWRVPDDGGEPWAVVPIFGAVPMMTESAGEIGAMVDSLHTEQDAAELAAHTQSKRIAAHRTRTLAAASAYRDL